MNPAAINKSCTTEIYFIWYIFIEQRVKQERGCGRNSPGGGKEAWMVLMLLVFIKAVWLSQRGPRDPERVIQGLSDNWWCEKVQLPLMWRLDDRSSKSCHFLWVLAPLSTACSPNHLRPANITDVELTRPLWNHVNGSWGWEMILPDVDSSTFVTGPGAAVKLCTVIH